MRVLSGVDFTQTVFTIIDWEFDGVDGIEPDTVGGTFFTDRFDELVEFCKKNPEIHIISYVGDCIRLNRAVPDAFQYRLALGDPDPSIICIPPWEYPKPFDEDD